MPRDFFLNWLLVFIVGQEECQREVLILFWPLLLEIVLDLGLHKLM